MKDQPPLGVALGLGQCWQPAPIGYGVAKINAMTGQGNQTLFVLRLETATGTVGFSFTADEFRAFTKLLTEQSTGLTIAGNGIVDGPLRGV